MKPGKLIGTLCLGALAVSLIPYRFQFDREAHTMEVRSLLWGIRKIPGGDKDHISFAIPASALDQDSQDTPDPSAFPGGCW